MIALAIFAPPVYFLIRKNIALFLLTSAMALFGLALVMFIAPPLILWAVSAIMAIRHWKRGEQDAQMRRHAEMVGQQVAANLSRNS